MNQLAKDIQKFSDDRDWEQFHTPENLAKSISIEAGELLECFQWTNDFNENNVKEELADVMNYCIQLANKLGVDYEEIIYEKMKKNAEKYPVEKAKGSAKKYTEL